MESIFAEEPTCVCLFFTEKCVLQIASYLLIIYVNMFALNNQSTGQCVNNAFKGNTPFQ